VTVGLGTPPQRIRVSLDKLGQDSYLFASTVCPEFIENCYDPDRFSTFELESGGFTVDRVILGPSKEIIHLQVHRSIIPIHITSRESAEVLGIGRLSAIMRGKLLRIRDTVNGGLQVGEVSEDYPY
jgi:hypothetical protein